METVQENIVTEYLEHNKALEQSPEFQKIEQEVDNEVYRLFALERIQQAKKYLAEHGDYEDAFDNELDAPTEYSIYLSKRLNRIKEAKRLLDMYPDKAEHAARLFIQLGSCHWIWAMKKRILKEKYCITWYTPVELNPDVIFD